MKITQISSIAFLIVSLMVTGCASMTKGTTQSLTVETKHDADGARCELSDSKSGKWHIPDTPGTVQVKKGDGPMTIVCSKEGYETAELVVEENFAGATLGNILLGGGIGVIIDASTGAAQEYPEQVVIWMKPTQWQSDEQRVEWETAKKDYEAELEAARIARDEAMQQKNSGQPTGPTG
ncbi:MAG: hypothetical protein AAGB35_09700 [Pseudomonadota bacterium]